MGTKSKFFRAFVEGNTISDGRKITADMIDQIVETFNAETYSPRINIEHIAGYSPEPPFNGYGTVTAVKAQTDDITIAGKVEKRRALYMQVDGNAQLVKLAKEDQKPFPSVELTDSYAGCGKVGVVGLAFTDTPASIATQPLNFSRSGPGTVFGLADEAVAIEFEAAQIEPAGLAATVSAAVAATFARLGFKPTEPKPEPVVTPPAPANDNAALYTAMSEAVSAGVAAATGPITAQVTKLAADFAVLTGKLDKTELPGFSRQPATGAAADAQYATDC
ncbi:MAG TPA: GPO family capsid scaffolding protein [Sphingomonas sp.]|uniref:GPO family capsid scaffolding protein n=1 Tax=Sphingomonas sp. TaxID=28214 RepID=UPI002EDB7D44